MNIYAMMEDSSSKLCAIHRCQMSVEELSKLSLADNMVTTRAAAARARTTPVDQSHSASTSPPPSRLPSSASPTPSLIESASGLKYDVAAFESESRRRAKHGLMDNDIKMKYCRLLDDESNQYLFYLDDEIQIAMGGRYQVPRCTCGANERGIACKVSFIRALKEHALILECSTYFGCWIN